MRRKIFIRAVTILSCCILTAHLGRITYLGHQETYYNLSMNRIVRNADSKLCIQAPYWVREDGCKMYGNFIIVAADYNYHPYGSLVLTSRGTGIVLDTGTFRGDIIDIATTW